METIEDCAGFLLERVDVEAMVNAFTALPASLPLTQPHQINALFEALRASVGSGDTRHAIALALALARSDADGLVRRLRRMGVLRISRIGFVAETTSAVAGALLATARQSALHADRCRYLYSVQTLQTLGEELAQLEAWLVSELARLRHCVLKTLLVIVDGFFLKGWGGGDVTLPGDHPLHYSAEDYAESLSSIIVLFQKHLGNSLEFWAFADPDGLLDAHDTYMAILVAMARLNRYRHAETQVDGLPYAAALVDGTVVVRSIDPMVEQSVRLGYALHATQLVLRRRHAARLQDAGEGPASLYDVARKGFDAGMSNHVHFVEHPPRLVFNMPSHPVLLRFLRDDGVSLEELISIYQLDADSFTAHDYLGTELVPGVTGLDLFRAQRVFGFVACMLDFTLKRFDDLEVRSILATQSVIMVLKRNLLINALGPLMDESKAGALVDLLTQKEGDHIDLQSAPLVKTGDFYVFSPGVMGASNLIRNITVARNLNRQKANQGDPMIEATVAALNDAGFRVRAGAKIPAGKKLDADILAFRDGVLFLFECKNAYHPCSIHEQRTSFDYIEHAAEQLSARSPALLDKSVQRDLFRSLAWPDADIASVRTVILTANRVFHGVTIGGHPVRQAHELISVLARGFFWSAEFRLRFWKGSTFSTTDLLDYLDGTVIIDDHFSSMDASVQVHPFGRKRLAFETWTFNIDRHRQRIIGRYPTMVEADGE